MQGLLRFYLFFCIKIKKFNNTGACILDSIHYMTLKVLKITFGLENVKIFPSFTQSYNGHHYVLLLNL